MKYLLIILLLFLLPACAYERHYYPDGQLKYDREGFIPWSSDKKISFEAHAL